MTMTREYAVKEGFISPVPNCIEEERKFPFVRITHWYQQGEEQMMLNAFRTMAGTNFLLIVDDARQALYRAIGEIKFYEGESCED